MTAQPTVIIVDDDPEIRESLEGLLRSVGLQVTVLGSVPEFVKEGRPAAPPLPCARWAANIHVPIVFIKGYGGTPMSVQAIKGGTIEFEFLTKPFRDQDLLDAIQLGLERDRAWLENEKAIAALRARFGTLTPANGSEGIGGDRPPQQADSLRYRDQRDHRKGPSRPGHAKDEGGISARPGTDDRQAGFHSRHVTGLPATVMGPASTLCWWALSRP
jgi:CheY-like chemotaxis protein